MQTRAIEFFAKAWLLLILAASFFSIATLATASADETDVFYNPICEAGKNYEKCTPKEKFIRRRDNCEAPGSLCFGIRLDGWQAEVLGKGDCIRPCTPTPFNYGIIEYKTEQNDTRRWQKAQRDTIIDFIKNKNAYVVIFIHGWHHNAKDNNIEITDNIDNNNEDYTQDRNMMYFKRILARSKYEINLRGEHDREVFGIYIGWNGGPPNSIFNIGNRARAADRLANSSDFIEDMNLISKFSSNNKILIMGHSLGGRIINRFMINETNKNNPRPFGKNSLAVSINAAISADSFGSLTKLNPSFDEPTWINFTSADDWATGAIYSGATSFGRLIGFGEGVSDKSFESSSFSSIGHYRPYLTHALKICWEDKGPYGCDSDVWWRDRCPIQSVRAPETWFRLSTSKPTSCVALCYDYENDRRCDDRYRASLSTISTDLTGAFRAPLGHFWNVTTDKDVIGGDEKHSGLSAINHNGFVQTNLNRLLTDILFAPRKK